MLKIAGRGRIGRAAVLGMFLFLPRLSAAEEGVAPSVVSPEEQQVLEESLGADAGVRRVPQRQTEIDVPTVGGSAPQSMNPDLALILDFALAGFNTSKPDQLGGHDPTQPGFNLQQLELHLGASVDPFFRLDSMIVYTAGGVELEEAYATSLALPANLQVRAGQFLTRFGRLNATHPHAWNFVDQPLVNGKFFGGDGNRGLGAEVSWLSFLPWYLEVVVSGTEAVGECCAVSYIGGSDEPAPMRTPKDAVLTSAIKQFFPLSDDLSLLWGVSGQTGPRPHGRAEIYGTDLYLRYRPLNSPDRQSLSLQVETMLRKRDTEADGKIQDWGGYAELVWALSPSWEVGGRGEYVTGVENDDLTPEWVGARTRYSAQITYLPSHFARLRLQGSTDHAPWRDAPVYAGFLALEVAIGAHGAHAY